MNTFRSIVAVNDSLKIWNGSYQVIFHYLISWYYVVAATSGAWLGILVSSRAVR
ncbi:MAG TPA: hypothetical protein VHF08_06335 [Nitrososphaeraceae archaeon]|nr:hypothetical protein [Nitrososphaeraceae archaeon]